MLVIDFGVWLLLSVEAALQKNITEPRRRLLFGAPLYSFPKEKKRQNKTYCDDDDDDDEPSR